MYRLSPIAVAWNEKVVKAPEANDVPVTGDTATPMLWVVCMLMAAIGCKMLIKHRKLG